MEIEDVDFFNKAIIKALFYEAGVSDERICEIAEQVKKQKEEAYDRLRLGNWLTTEQLGSLEGYLEAYLTKRDISQITANLIRAEKSNLRGSLAYSFLLSSDVVKAIGDSNLVSRLEEGLKEYEAARKLYG